MWIYIICFWVSLFVLIFLVAYGKVLNLNMIFLSMVVTIGNGGYFALSRSDSLESAIIATKLVYTIGAFVPFLTFLVVCYICKVKIPKLLVVIGYSIQVFIYLAVLSIGHSDIYYKTVVYYPEGGGSRLIKTYGPLHNLYVITLFLYLFLNLVVTVLSLYRKRFVSILDVHLILAIDIMIAGVYITERFFYDGTTLVPIVLTIGILILLNPIVKMYNYSIYDNRSIFEDKIKTTGYIMFNKRTGYMGCSEYAKALFPELADWEIEKKVPGNGGRFNTFLRQDFFSFVKNAKRGETKIGTYEYKDEIFRYEFGILPDAIRGIKGYYIQVENITDMLRKETKH